MLILKVCYHANPYSHKFATMLVLILINALPYYVVLLLTGLSLCYSPHSHKSASMLDLILTSPVRYHAGPYSHKVRYQFGNI